MFKEQINFLTNLIPNDGNNDNDNDDNDMMIGGLGSLSENYALNN